MLPRVRAVTRLSRRPTTGVATMKHRETSTKSGRFAVRMAAAASRQASVTAGDPADLSRACPLGAANRRAVKEAGKACTHKCGYYAATGTYPWLSARSFETHGAIVLASPRTTSSHHRAVRPSFRAAAYRGDAPRHEALRGAGRIGQNPPARVESHAPPSAPRTVADVSCRRRAGRRHQAGGGSPQAYREAAPPRGHPDLPTYRHRETLGGPWLR